MFVGRIRALFLAMSLCVMMQMASSLSSSAYAQSISAKDYVQAMANDAIKQLTDKTISDDERVRRIRTLLHADFDGAAISKFVLGTSWPRATTAQRDEFQKLYEMLVAYNYAILFKRYTGQKFQVVSERPIDDMTMVVNAQVNSANGGTAIPVEIQVDKEGQAWKATDVKVGGVSMLLAHRKEYASVINRSHNGIDGLLDAMRVKVRELDAGEDHERNSR